MPWPTPAAGGSDTWLQSTGSRAPQLQLGVRLGQRLRYCIFASMSTHAAVRPRVPGGRPLAMFGSDSLPVRETLASSHAVDAPPVHQHYACLSVGRIARRVPDSVGISRSYNSYSNYSNVRSQGRLRAGCATPCYTTAGSGRLPPSRTEWPAGRPPAAAARGVHALGFACMPACCARRRAAGLLGMHWDFSYPCWLAG